MDLTENDIASKIVQIGFDIHVTLGPGLLESVYEEVFHYELIAHGFYVQRQKAIPVYWKGNKMNLGFRADLIVEDKVLIELKSVEFLAPVHMKQTLTYLKLTDLKLGLLINFNQALFKDGINRVVNDL